MLIVDDKLMALDDQMDAVVAELLKLPEVAAYRRAKTAFQEDQALQKKIFDCSLQREGTVNPTERRQLQHEINLNEKVYALRLAENDLQEILSKLTQQLAAAISDEIYVDENLPLKGGGRHERYHRKDNRNGDPTA